MKKCSTRGDVCLDQLQRLGASSGRIALVRAFLEGQITTINADGQAVTRVWIARGSPKGSEWLAAYCSTSQRSD